MQQTDPEATTPLGAFRAVVAPRPDLSRRLAAHVVPEAFIADAQELAATFCISLDRESLYNAMRPDPIGISRFLPAPSLLDGWPIAGWRPARAAPTPEGPPAIDWVWFGDDRPTSPLYEDDTRRHGSSPFSLVFRPRTSLDALIAGAGDAPRAPNGLIFHMSRCGSTLAAQMLAAVPHHLVASEPPPLDAVVQWATAGGVPLAEQVAALRAIVAALGRGPEQRFFIKLDSWHARALSLFRAAFPTTPWIFLHRDPVEVMVSLQRLPGMQALPGGLPPHVLDIADGETMSQDEYIATVLARICGGIIDNWHVGGGLLVDYRDLPGAMYEAVAHHLGYTPSKDELGAMTAAAAFDAKAPGQRFSTDSAAKQRIASPHLLAATVTQLSPVYERLRRLA